MNSPTSRVALSYALWAGLLILTSDLISDFVVTDRLFFVGIHLTLAIISVILLFLLLKRELGAREEAEANRHATEQRLANILNTAADAIIAVSRDYRILVFNRGAEKLFGYQAGELLGQPLDVLLPPNWVEQHRRHFETFAASPAAGQSFNQEREIRGRRRDGTEFPAEASISKLAENGNLTFTIILRDITPRKQAQEALHLAYEELERRVQERTSSLVQANGALQKEIRAREEAQQAREQLLSELKEQNQRAEKLASEARHRADELDAIFGALADGVIFFDAQGIVRRANPAAIETSGLELIGMSQASVAKELAARQPDGRSIPFEELPANRALRGEVVQNQPLILSNTAGRDFYVLISASPLLSEGVVWGGIAVIKDVSERERLLQQLETERAHLEAILHQMPAGVVIAEAPTGRVILSNQQVERILDRSPFVTNGDVGEYGYGPGFSRNGRRCKLNEWPLARAIGTGEIVNNEEIDFLRGDEALSGTLAASAAPIEDRDGRIVGGVMTFHDVSARRQGEIALQKSEERYRTLVEHISESILIVDQTGVVRFINPAAELLFCCKAKEMLSQAFGFPVVIGESIELDILQKGQNPAIVEMRVVTTEWDDEPAFLVSLRDITERKQAEQLLREAHSKLELRVLERTRALAQANAELRSEISERRLVEHQLRLQTAALEAAANGIIITDHQGRIRWANPAFTAMTGYITEEVLGQEPRFLKSDHHEPEFYQQMWETILAGDVWHGETVNRRKDGTLYYEEQTITPMLDESGTVSHFIAIKQDITERIQAYQLLEQRVEERTQELSTLLEISSHLLLTLELEPMLQFILDHLKVVVDYHGAGIFKLDGEKLSSLACRGDSNPCEAKLAFLPQQSWLGNQLIAKQKPVIVADCQGESQSARAFRKLSSEQSGGSAAPIRAWMAVPLPIKEQVIGILMLQHREPDHFSLQQLELILAFANQAALAIENNRLYEQAQDLAALEERHRLARDLHDAVSQTLFSASLAAEVLPRLWENNPQQGQRCLREVQRLNRGALAEMRTLLLELRPAVLVESELGDLLKQLAEAVASRSQIPICVTAEEKCILPPDVQTALYRITQEALNNVIKHAGASEVRVRLGCLPPAGPNETSREIELFIGDNGRGFDTNRIQPDSMGLGIMRERAAAIAATFEIESQPGLGTIVKVVWFHGCSEPPQAQGRK